MGDAFALQPVYIFLPLVALAGGFALILVNRHRAREGASRIAPAKDPAPTIRVAVAYNAKTPAAVIESLARDAEPQIRIAVTTNAALPRVRAEAMLKRRGGS